MKPPKDMTDRDLLDLAYKAFSAFQFGVCEEEDLKEVEEEILKRMKNGTPPL